MAVSTPTTVFASGNTANASSYDTQSVVLTANRLYLLCVAGYRSGGSVNAESVTHDPTGTPLSFTTVTDGTNEARAQGFGDADRRTIAVWRVIPASTTANAVIRIVWAAGQSAMSWRLVEIASGFDATTPFPKVRAQISSVTDNTATVPDFSSFDGTGSLMLAMFGIGTGVSNPANIAIDETEGRTELGQHWENERTNQAVHYQNPNGGDTTVNATIGGSANHWGAIGIEIKAAGAADTPIDAQPGSYSVSGVAAVAQRAITIVALAGSLALSGFAADTQRAIAIDAQPGSYALSGAASGADFGFPANSGAYVVTGAAATTARDKTSNAEPGSYALTGAASGADLGFSAGSGAYAVTGAAATTQRNVSTNAAPGSYVLAGVASGANLGFPAQPGSYALTGVASGANLGFPAQSGSYVLTGATAATQYRRFPVVVGVQAGVQSSDSSTWTLTYPSPIQANDLLLLFAATDGNATSVSLPAGWTALGSGSGFGSDGNVSLIYFYKIATGSESGNFTLTLGAIERGAWRIRRIAAATWHGTTPPERTSGGIVVGNSTTPNPPQVIASWGSDDNLFFVLFGVDGNVTVSAYPINYVDGVSDSPGSVLGALLGSAHRELTSLANDPASATISLTEQWGALTVVVRPALAAPSINAQPGVYALTGAAATMLRDIPANAQPGVYALTGAAASADLAINAAAGSYALTGAAATTLRDIPANAQPGSYDLTGVAADTHRAVAIDAQPGNYDLTGVAADTHRAVAIDAQPGSYDLTGAAATTLRDIPANAQPGSYDLTGAAATTLRDIPANAQPGSYDLTGVAAETEAPGATIDAQPGSYDLTGVAAETEAPGATIDAQPGSYALTGAAASFGLALPAQPTTYALAGAPVDTRRDAPSDAQPATYAITGFEATFVIDRVSIASPTTYAVSGVAATTSTVGVDQYGSIQGWDPNAIDINHPQGLRRGQLLGRSSQGAGPGADFPS